MKKFAGLSLAIVMALTMTACGDNASTGATNKGTLDGNFEVGTVIVEGKTVTCVTMKRGIGDTSWGGMSCDFAGALDETKP